MYPAVVITAMFGVGALMLILVVPMLAVTFEDLGVDLPLTTRIIIFLGDMLSRFWFIVFPGIFGAGIVVLRLTRTSSGKRMFDALVLRLPILGNIIRKTNAALMIRTLSALISAGVPIVRGLEIASKVVGNVHFQDSLVVASDKVAKGEKLSDTLRKYTNLYPIMVPQMIAVGEETGETGSILRKLAEFFEGEVSQITKNLTSIIEPILMLIIGAAVGFFAISMIQPMYGMLGSLQ